MCDNEFSSESATFVQLEFLNAVNMNTTVQFGTQEVATHNTATLTHNLY